MPNHFHLLTKQLTDGGITRFVRIVADSYGKYFNILHDRAGPLFQGKFKSVRIEDNSQLLHVSRYIHLNPLTAHLVESPIDYPWLSYGEYTKSESESEICTKNIILDQFGSKEAYKSFVDDYASYQKEFSKIEHLILE